MATSALCLLVRALSRTALLCGQLASLRLLVSVGMRFGESGARLNRLGGLAEDHRELACALPCLTCCARSIARERGGLALDSCRVSGRARHPTRET